MYSSLNDNNALGSNPIMGSPFVKSGARAFKLLEARERKIKKLKDKIAIGTEQIAKGQVTDGEIVFKRLGIRN